MSAIEQSKSHLCDLLDAAQATIDNAVLERDRMMQQRDEENGHHMRLLDEVDLMHERIGDLEEQLRRSTVQEQTEWIVTRLRNVARDFEERYRPLDEEVPKTKQP